MTYIDLLNAFHRGLETNSLPSTSQLMYFHLLNVCNRCCWAEWVQVDNRRLMCMMQISDEKTLMRARVN